MVEGAYPVPRLDIFMKRESRQNRSVGRKFKSVKVQTVVFIVRMHMTCIHALLTLPAVNKLRYGTRCCWSEGRCPGVN